ncbi:MAG: hypothetical protein BWY31_02465 [Lentisphaerae bacterium ADurb.Bin242]|nr:MAG: hypothetical protein BWY31_02465 [Lentisphaerae bacterium ADurb.Bin242]
MIARKLFVACAAVSLLGLAPVLYAADDAASTSPGTPAIDKPAGPGGARFQRGREGGPGQRPFGGAGLVPRGPMSEEDAAKFKELAENVKTAVDAYRKSGDEKNKAAVKTAVTALVDAQQKFEVDRAEKALARAKAGVQEKDKIVDRIVDRMTSAKADKPGPKGERPRGARKGERPAAPQPAPDNE